MRITKISLEYAPPFDWPFFLRYLGARATPGVERVTSDTYQRCLDSSECSGLLQVTHDSARSRLIARIDSEGAIATEEVVQRLRRMFDLDAELGKVRDVLGADSLLGPLLRLGPGVRIPGTWSEYELLIRIITGQQVTVKAATTIMGRIAARLNRRNGGIGKDSDLIPFLTPRELADCNLQGIGMPAKRVAALQTVARAVTEGTVSFSTTTQDVAKIKETLLGLPGIGRWTVEYFALRGLHDIDAWPATDLILRRATAHQTTVGQSGEAATWSPYRGYAAMHLWNHASDLSNLTSHSPKRKKYASNNKTR